MVALFAWFYWPAAKASPQVFYPTDFSQAPDGIVGFPSYTARTTGDLLDLEARAEAITSGGLLVLPTAATAEAPVPAVVILHGSGGDWSGRSVYLANRLAKNGIAALAVNTFVARDLRSSDPYLERLKKAPIFSQLVDGLQALKALQEHPLIDAERIAVTGFSMGAANALYSMFEPAVEHILGKDGPRFSAYAAFYAGCSFDFEDFRVEGSPVLIMMGELDESMSVPRCQALVEKLRAKHVDVALKVYPGAGHGWELPYPAQFNPTAVVTKDCEMLWTREHINIEVNTQANVDTTFGAIRAFSECSHASGYTMGLHPPTKEQSWLDFHSFLMASWQSAP